MSSFAATSPSRSFIDVAFQHRIARIKICRAALPTEIMSALVAIQNCIEQECDTTPILTFNSIDSLPRNVLLCGGSTNISMTQNVQQF